MTWPPGRWALASTYALPATLASCKLSARLACNVRSRARREGVCGWMKRVGRVAAVGGSWWDWMGLDSVFFRSSPREANVHQFVREPGFRTFPWFSCVTMVFVRPVSSWVCGAPGTPKAVPTWPRRRRCATPCAAWNRDKPCCFSPWVRFVAWLGFAAAAGLLAKYAFRVWPYPAPGLAAAADAHVGAAAELPCSSALSPWIPV